jgi:membrane protein DedA with SNARE-associated domain
LDEAGAPIVEHREPRKGHLALLITPIAVMVAMGYVADALWPTLVEEHPLWLLGLSARNRYAVLVVNRVDLWAYYLLGTFRLLLPDPFFFALGWMYGPAALRWMEQRTPTVGSQMRRLEGYFGTWGYPLVVVIPNNYVCLIAGAARMSIPVFAALNVVGTVGRLLMLQVVGDIFSDPIDTLLGWISDYRIPLLVVSVAVVAVMAGGELRRGRKEIEGLQELEQAGERDGEHGLGGTPDEPGDGPPGPVVDGGDGPASPSG